jgi:predicted nucleotidyltransferase
MGARPGQWSPDSGNAGQAPETQASRRESLVVKPPAAPLIGRIQSALESDPNVAFAYLFGSTVRFPARAPRDLDVAVYYATPPDGLTVLDEIQRLSTLTGREVDLVVLNDAPAMLRHQVVKHGLRLSCRDPAQHTAFREHTIRDYQTYRHLASRVA